MTYKIYIMEHLKDKYVIGIPKGNYLISDCRFYKVINGLEKITENQIQLDLLKKIKNKDCNMIMEMEENELEKAVKFVKKIFRRD